MDDIIISKKQKHFLDLMEDPTITELLVGGAAGGGKSYSIGMIVALWARKYPGVRFFVGRKTLKSLKQSTINTMLSKVFPALGITVNDYHMGWQNMELTFKNGSLVIFGELDYAPSDPVYSRVGSLEIDVAIIDEAGEITRMAKDAIKSRTGRGVMAQRGMPGKLLLGSNPDINWLKDEYYDPYEKLGGGGFQKWQIGEIDVNGQKQPTYRAFLRAGAYDNPFLPQSYIDNLKTLPPILKKRLLDGNWNYADDENSLFRAGLLDKAMCYEFPESSPENTFIGVDLADSGCFDDQTEILTAEGWKYFEDLEDNEKVFTRDKDGVAKYEPIQQIHKYPYDGELYYYESPELSFAVTPNHRMLCRQSMKKQNELRQIQDIKWKYWKVCRTIDEYQDTSGLEPCLDFYSIVPQFHGGFRKKEWHFEKGDWFEFVGWFASEGCVVSERGRYKVSISQKRGTVKSDRIEKLLCKMGIKHTHIGNNFTFYNNSIAEHLLEEVGHLAPNKRIPQYIVKSDDWPCVERFLDGFCMGDGSYRKGRRQSYNSTSKAMVDDIQEILCHFNRAGKIVKTHSAGSQFEIEGRTATRRNNCYRLTEVIKASDTEIGQTKSPVRQKYKGYVYCATTPTSTLYVRRKGTCYWTGNSDFTVFSLMRNGVLVSQKRSSVQMNWEKDSRLPMGRMVTDELVEFAQRNGIDQRLASHIAVECNGIGNSVRDFLRERGWQVLEYTATHKSRSENYYNLMMDMDAGDIKIYQSMEGLDELKRELMAHSFELINQEPSVVKKDKIKQAIGHSPDFADSFQIANYARRLAEHPELSPRTNRNRLVF